MFTAAHSLPTARDTTDSTLTDCLHSKDVPISLIRDTNFASLAKPYNLRLPYTPTVIILPTTPQHVSDAVLCAGAHNIKVQAKSGGHSYASYSSGGQNGSMMVHLQSMQNITLDADSGIVSVGGGIRLGNLAQGIWDQGKRALAHGTCPGVGIGGHFTHGGYGYDSRMWGLAMDAIVGLDVVLANGSFVHATETEYPEVYWALRGAADSFGIITTFHLQTQAAPSTVITWSYTIPGMFDSASTSATSFTHIQSFAQNASVVDRNLGFGMYMDGSGFSISGTYIGTQSHFTTIIATELLRGLPTPTASTVQAVDWIKSLTLLSNQDSLTEPTAGYSAHDNFFAKSVTVPESAPLTTAALQSYWAYMIANGTNPVAPWYTIVNLYGGPDSQINDNKNTSFAAYADRSSLWVFQHYVFTSGATLPDAAIPFLDGFNESLTREMPGAGFGAYLNYVDPSLSASEAHELYYGEELYERLKELKGRVDPQGVFWNPQAVGA
ncbi:Glucooligosaccharide oxidase [Saccharata proteae CBS 121410]|uniref:Glucooligosaccharide oxidase n=1 Tax=Saccharata proteae CBS 121410 TaxID=1314787 RepID=A0A9P4HX37_9PEZI|nr:Glucooligosaccharide oxidase [Saccharata proteae CBS 121410]